MLIFLYICMYWQKNNFLKWSQETSFSSKCWYFRIYGQTNIFKTYLKKRPFSWKVNIDIKITIFSSKYWYLRIYGQKTIFFKWTQKTWFTPICSIVCIKETINHVAKLSKVNPKKCPFPRNIDICRLMP